MPPRPPSMAYFFNFCVTYQRNSGYSFKIHIFIDLLQNFVTVFAGKESVIWFNSNRKVSFR